MNRFIKSIVVFIIFSAFIYLLMILLWGNFAPIKKNLRYELGADGHTFSRLRDLDTTRNVDLLFLGSSHTYRGFDNRIFRKAGYSSFNLGSNSQTPLQTLYLLENSLDQLNPKLIVFEICPYVFSLDGVESSIEIISNDSWRKNSMDLIFSQNHLKVYNTALYTAYRRLLYQDIEKLKEGVQKNNDTYIPGGFVEIKLFHYKKEHFSPTKWNARPKQMEAFEKILEMFDNRGIPFVLIQAPVTTDLYNSYKNNSEFDSVMQKYGDYYNFNERLELNDSLYFFDFHHLNKYGIEIFNKEVTKIVTSFDELD